MGKTYSKDLREKVVQYVKEGNTKRAAARLFQIGEDTVFRWLRLEKKTGTLSPKKRTSFRQKLDPEKLKEHVDQHPDHTIAEIAHALKVAKTTVFNWLRRLKITRKKSLRSAKNVTR
jgi:transposase